MPQHKQAQHKQLIEQERQHHENIQRDAALCRLLLRQALYDSNDAAWDAITPHLRTLALQQLYQRAPDLAPRAAEQLAVRTLLDFIEQLGRQTTRTSYFPSYAKLVRLLGQSAEKMMRAVAHKIDRI